MTYIFDAYRRVDLRDTGTSLVDALWKILEMLDLGDEAPEMKEERPTLHNMLREINFRLYSLPTQNWSLICVDEKANDFTRKPINKSENGSDDET